MQNPTNARAPRASRMRVGIILWTLANLLLLIDGTSCPSHAGPISITDDGGKVVQLYAPPERVVSLVPSVTQMIADIGAADALVGVTYHDTQPAALSRKAIVGGFFAPSIEIIETLQPDVIFYTGIHRQVETHFNEGQVAMIRCDTRSVEHGFKTLRKIGRLFNRIKAADAIVSRNREELDLIRRKVDVLPKAQRKRVMRIMGRHSLMTPGADSFQNEIIRLAGGVPPEFVAPGGVVPVDAGDWIAFNPQVIYGCGGDRRLLQSQLSQPEWEGVAALRTNRVFFFPCDLTCRASTRIGYFATWLAARIYAEAFSDPTYQVFKDGVVASEPIDVRLSNVRDVRVVETRIRDFVHKTLVVALENPTAAISTLEGPLNGIDLIGNHYLPPPSWYIDHGAGPEQLKEHVCRVLGVPAERSALLFTGAHMDHLAIARTTFRQMRVTAMVTAGVETNAVRMSKDVGSYYEPGTINILLHTNMNLSPRAMTRAIISATEAKSAALADLDIRSSYRPLRFGATGTGTDNIIVVPSPGVPIANAGGHSKMGELIAKAVYEAVMKAVAKQNGLTTHRSIFKRLEERGIDIEALMTSNMCPCLEGHDCPGRQALEHLLLESRYIGFMESALAMSDAFEKGLVSDMTGFGQYCQVTAERIAGGKIPRWQVCLHEDHHLPDPLKRALEALLNGLLERKSAMQTPLDSIDFGETAAR